MDSKAVNKLIRSEVWPLLRQQGFSKFNARNAWRYQEHFIEVVNFQSFNSYLADGIGCTSFSFAANLGVYVRGSEAKDKLKQDRSGLWMPQEYDGSFRVQLRKRSPIDGFERDDIFYIDPEGNTVGPVFDEVRHLIQTVGLTWFHAVSDLDSALAWVADGRQPTGLPSEYGTHSRVGLGSCNSLDLLLRLRVLADRARPSKESAKALRDAFVRTVVHAQDVAVALLDTPWRLESDARRFATRARDLGITISEDEAISVLRESSTLSGRAWLDGSSVEEDSTSTAAQTVPRKHLWPSLRQHGFSEFTERLAHRVSHDCIEVVAAVAVKPEEVRKRGIPSGLSRLGLGLYWPRLEAGIGEPRRNRKGEPRPTLPDCHLRMWLTSEPPGVTGAATVFLSPDDALDAVVQDGLPWLDLCRSADTLTQLLDRPDLDVLGAYPMMRGQGSSESVQRSLLLAVLASLRRQNEAIPHHIERAFEAAGSWSGNRQDFFLRWIWAVSTELRVG